MKLKVQIAIAALLVVGSGTAGWLVGSRSKAISTGAPDTIALAASASALDAAAVLESLDNADLQRARSRSQLTLYTNLQVLTKTAPATGPWLNELIGNTRRSICDHRKRNPASYGVIDTGYAKLDLGGLVDSMERELATPR